MLAGVCAKSPDSPRAIPITLSVSYFFRAGESFRDAHVLKTSELLQIQQDLMVHLEEHLGI